MSNKKVFSTLGASAHTQKEREKDDFYWSSTSIIIRRILYRNVLVVKTE